jgi:hypothetical protein
MTVLQFSKPFLFTPRLEEQSNLRRCRLEECRGACCLHGVWLDPLEKIDIMESANVIAPFLAAERRDPATWFTEDREEEPDFPSGYVIAAKVLENPKHYGGTACVFLRSDARCALQAAGESQGLHPWRFKPFHCIIHPLTFDDRGRITLATDDELAAEPGSCFRTCPAPRPLAEELAPELEFLRTGLPYGKMHTS